MRHSGLALLRSRTALALVLLATPCMAFGDDDLRDEVPPDLVVRNNGRKLEGTVVFLDATRVIVRVGSRDKEAKLSDVASMRAKLIELPKALERCAALKPGDIPGRSSLAEELRTEGMPLEARLLQWEILVLDPEHVQAHEFLGHRKSGKRWRVPIESRWYPMDKADEIHADFGYARMLSTTHFDVRTNLPLADAVRVAWHLERTYLAFYELFGAELGLFQVVEPMSIWVYADFESFPKGMGERSYFSRADERAYIARGGQDTRTLVHETVHQILFSIDEVMGSRAEIPGWLNEGLAQYMPLALDGLGRPFEDAGELLGYSKNRFREHVGSDREYGLKRVLNFSTGDFHGTSHRAEKYAAAYTITHFLLHGEQGMYRAGFAAFIRGALKGSSSATDFKKALGIKKEKDFEAAWRAYSKSMADR